MQYTNLRVDPFDSAFTMQILLSKCINTEDLCFYATDTITRNGERKHIFNLSNFCNEYLREKRITSFIVPIPIIALFQGTAVSKTDKLEKLNSYLDILNKSELHNFKVIDLNNKLFEKYLEKVLKPSTTVSSDEVLNFSMHVYANKFGSYEKHCYNHGIYPKISFSTIKSEVFDVIKSKYKKYLNKSIIKDSSSPFITIGDSATRNIKSYSTMDMDISNICGFIPSKSIIIKSFLSNESFGHTLGKIRYTSSIKSFSAPTDCLKLYFRSDTDYETLDEIMSYAEILYLEQAVKFYYQNSDLAKKLKTMKMLFDVYIKKDYSSIPKYCKLSDIPKLISKSDYIFIKCKAESSKFRKNLRNPNFALYHMTLLRFMFFEESKYTAQLFLDLMNSDLEIDIFQSLFIVSTMRLLNLEHPLNDRFSLVPTTRTNYGGTVKSSYFYKYPGSKTVQSRLLSDDSLQGAFCELGQDMIYGSIEESIQAHEEIYKAYKDRDYQKLKSIILPQKNKKGGYINKWKKILTQ